MNIKLYESHQYTIMTVEYCWEITRLSYDLVMLLQLF